VPRKTDPRTRVLAAIESATTASRRDGDAEVPLGRKATRTRQSLLEAAYTLFTRDGYSATTVGDIAAEAGVSLGAFYQYFRDRGDIMAALVGEGAKQMLEDTERVWRPADGREGVHRTLIAFVGHYRNTAGFQRAWEEVTHVDADLADVRRELIQTFAAGVEAALRRGQDDGTIRRDLDPSHTAVALTSMCDRTCYVRFVLDERGHRVSDVAESLTDLWWNAVKA
jgi:AcrR family transcriptional regulator